MKDRLLGIISSLAALVVLYSYTGHTPEYTVEDLRRLYGSGNPSLWPKPSLFPEVKKGFQDIGVLPDVEFPKDNPFSKAKASLGKTLFFEPKLSLSGKISCASCHKPEKAWADNTMINFGHDDAEGLRNVPTVLNSAYAKSFFWDGRAKTLEEQVKHPIENPVEMNLKADIAVKNIAAAPEYKSLFKAAFGDENITEDRIYKALATFERTLISPKSRFDSFISGNKDEFSNSEVRGLHLFRTKANCINCHNTPYFSDQNFYNIGIGFFSGGDDDLGLYDVTKNPADKKKFRTPTLREVSQTRPYMHNGQFPELRNVVMMYNVGMGPENLTKKQRKDPNIPKKTHLIKKLELTDQEATDLVAFLRTLKGYQYSEKN